MRRLRRMLGAYLKMIIEDFGARVASVWQGLRSTTRNLIVGALQQSSSNGSSARRTPTTPYDARADLELSRLLAALDERAIEDGAALNADQARELRRMADTTAELLQYQTRSAEVFAQLVARAHVRNDFARIDALADALSSRFAPSEICELTRTNNQVVRALALEAMVLLPTRQLVTLLVDPVDGDIAREALDRQAFEYESEEARQIVNALDGSYGDIDI
jgi:hypothetical protein